MVHSICQSQSSPDSLTCSWNLMGIQKISQNGSGSPNCIGNSDLEFTSKLTLRPELIFVACCMQDLAFNFHFVKADM